MNKYCQTCGTKHAISANFCGECGTPFPGNKIKPPTQNIVANAANYENDDDNDDDNEGARVNVNDIKLDPSQVVITQSRVNRSKVQDLIASSKPEPVDFNRPPEPKVSRKKFLEQFKQEAGSIKQKGSK